MNGYIDTHAHLSLLDERGIDTESLLDELFDDGCAAVIDIGVEEQDLSARQKRFSRYKKIWYSSGLWPSEQNIARRRTAVERLRQSILEASPGSVVALGECGLDRFWNKKNNDADLTGEKELFELQIDLAKELQLPVIVHSRDAAEESLEIIQNHPGCCFIIHCFSYGPDEAEKFLAENCYISFAGNLTFKNAQALRDSLKLVPMDRLLFETDSPYLAPVPYRGQAAHPGMTRMQYSCAAGIKQVQPEALVKQVQSNVQAAFGIATLF